MEEVLAQGVGRVSRCVMKHKHKDRAIKKVNDQGREWIDHTCECGIWCDWVFTAGELKGQKVPVEML